MSDMSDEQAMAAISALADVLRAAIANLKRENAAMREEVAQLRTSLAEFHDSVVPPRPASPRTTEAL
jgi:cell division septum initiation protein DivIVA